MESHRPRPSVLSLFDPLSSSSNKENEFLGETSFFNTSGTPNEPQAPFHIPKRRLVDVGDMTLDSPDMHDLFIDETDLEDEINQSVAEEEDDNETLTFRDMAKAATPKWSGRHITSFATPKNSPTPRTPLVEIPLKDVATPLARKKPFRRPIQAESKPSQIEVEASPADTHDISSPEPSEISGETTMPNTSTPSIEISTHEGTPEGTVSEGLGSSVSTLNFPNPTEALIADTSIPHAEAPASPHTSPNTLLPPPTARLRPTSNSPASFNAGSRYSVDLQSSFQIHLSTSESTFDLLNEKISFFCSNDGNESFLDNLEIDNSFGETDFGSAKSTVGEEVISREPSPVQRLSPEFQENSCKNLTVDIQNVKPSCQVPQHAPEPTRPSNGYSIRKLLPSVRNGATLGFDQEGASYTGSTSGSRIAKSIASSEPKVLSTPNSSSLKLQPPPPPVPALRIVKRTKLIPRMSISTATSSSSRRTGSVPAVPAANLILRSTLRQSPPELGSRLIGKKNVDEPRSIKEVKRTSALSSFNNAPVPGDGPRRVLISENPKLSNTRMVDQARSFSTVSGPRRVVVGKPTNPEVERAPALTKQASSGLKQPGKYATVGATSIPKPVARAAGSRLLAAQGSKQRFGAFPGRGGD